MEESGRILDDLESIQRVDRSSMFEILERSDEQLRDACRIASAASLDFEGSEIRNVLACGLGGSAIGADFLKACFGDQLGLPLLVHRSYAVPAFVDDTTLVLASSYSGNTEETLSAFRKARERKAKIVCFCSGGELEQLARNFSLPLVKFPPRFPPRTAMGYSVFSILSLLTRLGLIRNHTSEIDKTRVATRHCISSYRRSSRLDGNPAKQLAVALQGRVNIVYGSHDGLDVIARRWAGQFCENSKQLSYFNSLPEMTHNEIVGWRHPEDGLKNLNTILLRDMQDHQRVQIRADWVRESLETASGYCREIWSPSGSRLERFWSLVLLGDFASLYLAVLNGVDPTPVDPIERLKEQLRRLGKDGSAR